jgi:hypothetical protein
MSSGASSNTTAKEEKAFLDKIKLTKDQSDQKKKLDDAFKKKEKEIQDVAKAIAGGSNSAGGRGGGGTSPEAMAAISNAGKEHLKLIRSILTEEQAKAYDANVVAYEKKLADQRQGRGRGGS